jgi:hypothetical protein
VAQLGARFHGMEEVIGSIPIRSTNQTNNLADSQKRRDTLSIRRASRAFLRLQPAGREGLGGRHPELVAPGHGGCVVDACTDRHFGEPQRESQARKAKSR